MSFQEIWEKKCLGREKIFKQWRIVKGATVVTEMLRDF
jgi:hypothetical protein